jgi:hypothetical protein
MLAWFRRGYAEERLWKPPWLRRVHRALSVAGLATVAYVLVEHPPRRFWYVLVVLSLLSLVLGLAEVHYRDRWTRGQRSDHP